MSPKSNIEKRVKDLAARYLECYNFLEDNELTHQLIDHRLV